MIKLEPDVERELAHLVKRNSVSLDSFVREALIEKIKEGEGIAMLEEALRDPEAGRRVLLEQLKRELRLDS